MTLVKKGKENNIKNNQIVVTDQLRLTYQQNEWTVDIKKQAIEAAWRKVKIIPLQSATEASLR